MRYSWILLAVILLAGAVRGQQSWQPVGWGGGGLYWSCAFDPQTDGTIYLGGDVLGVYRSVDHGLNWTIINNGLTGYEVLSLMADATTPGRVYALTNAGLCRSDDRGDHWTVLPETVRGKLGFRGEKGKTVRAIAVDPADAERLWAALPDGRIARSDDGGAGWTIVHTVAGGSCASVIVANGSPRALVASTEGILGIDESGKPAVLQAGRAMSIAASADGQTLYAAMDTQGVAKSIDGGTTWTMAGGGFGAGEKLIDITVSSKDPNIVNCIGTKGWDGAAYASADGGSTWTRVANAKGDAANNPTDQEAVKSRPVAISNPRALGMNPQNDQELFIAANWRPLHSNDGGKTWNERSKGADISVVTDVRFHAGKTYVVAMDEGAFVRDDATGNWEQLLPRRWDKAISGHMWRVRAWDEGKQILVTSSPWDELVNQVFRSLDGGETFIPVRDGLDFAVPKADTMWERGYPRALAAADPTMPYTLYLGIDGAPDGNGPGGGVFKSIDGGWHWKRLENQPASRRVFYGLAVDPTDPQRVYFGTCGDQGGLFRSEDGGESWDRVFDKEKWVFNVHVTSDGTVYCPGKELWRSTDHGKTWQQLTRRGDGIDIVGLETDGDRIWYSTVPWGPGRLGDVYESTDAGKTWNMITLDIPYRQPLVLRYNSVTKQLWAGGTGLFALPR